jgi:hypothetical protein
MQWEMFPKHEYLPPTSVYPHGQPIVFRAYASVDDGNLPGAYGAFMGMGTGSNSSSSSNGSGSSQRQKIEHEELKYAWYKDVGHNASAAALSAGTLGGNRTAALAAAEAGASCIDMLIPVS